jgi:hypothetical protein
MGGDADPSGRWGSVALLVGHLPTRLLPQNDHRASHGNRQKANFSLLAVGGKAPRRPRTGEKRNQVADGIPVYRRLVQ